MTPQEWAEAARAAREDAVSEKIAAREHQARMSDEDADAYIDRYGGRLRADAITSAVERLFLLGPA